MDKQFTEYITKLDEILHTEDSFDFIRKRMIVAGKHEAILYYIDGFVKDGITEKLMEYYIKAPDLTAIRVNLPYTEAEETADYDKMVTMVLSGATLLVVDGLPNVMIIDTREYPVRSIEEPENDKVLRGPRDGFTETLIYNTVMIRRHLRDPNLRMEYFSVGERTRTDLTICYVRDIANADSVARIKQKLSRISVSALSMGQQSLAELLIQKGRLNPFPKIRYTERPDVVSATLLEGGIAIICDNYPAVMLLPTSVFDFMQESDDYYFPPLVGSYLRILRIVIFAATLFLIPIWYLLTQHPDITSVGAGWLHGSGSVRLPVIWQLLLVEFAIDGLKMASLNTPSTLSNSLSVVAGLILGDFAVQIGWLIPEVIVCMAFVSIANFTQSSYELGYAFKFSRIVLLVLSAFFGWWGFGVGTALILITVATNPTVDEKHSYLYPVFPFCGKALCRLLIRVPLRTKWKDGRS